jgi:hypothetical protein
MNTSEQHVCIYIDEEYNPPIYEDTESNSPYCQGPFITGDVDLEANIEVNEKKNLLYYIISLFTSNN